MTSRPAQRIRLTSRGAYNSLRLDKRRMIHLDELRYLDGRLGKWVVLRTESARRFRRIHVTRLERSLWYMHVGLVSGYGKGPHESGEAAQYEELARDVRRATSVMSDLEQRLAEGRNPTFEQLMGPSPEPSIGQKLEAWFRRRAEKRDNPRSDDK
jgi:hypothetical protein